MQCLIKWNIDKDQPMIDLVFGVDEPLEWHTANLHRNPKHYSGVGKLGASAIVNVQVRRRFLTLYRRSDIVRYYCVWMFAGEIRCCNVL